MKYLLENRKIISLLVYLSEFSLSIIFSVLSFQILYSKQYIGYYPLDKIIFATFIGFAIIGIIIYVCKNNKGIIEKMFISFAIPISIGYAIFILPLNVPDEGTHILRAYDVSIGNIFTQIDKEGNSSSTLIKALENYSYMRFQNYQDVIGEISQSTNYDEQIQRVCAAQGNSPILYIGTACGFIISRIFNVNAIIAIYIARLFNVFIFLIFGYFSIKKIPFGKLLLAVYLCMPMMIQQAASCSADAILNAVIIYYIAHLIYMIFKDDAINKKDKIILYVLTALVAMFKFVYIVIAGIFFIILSKNKENKKEKIKSIAIMILIGSIFSLGWMTFSFRYKSQPESFIQYNKIANVDSSRQIGFIKENPIKFIKTFIMEYLKYGLDYIYGAVGTPLGWINVNINTGIIALFILVLIISAISENSIYDFSTKSKLWIIAILFVISALIFGSMYVAFTPVGLDRICGVQGRYFTPILVLLPIILIKKNNYWKIKNVNEKLLVFSLILNMLTLVQIFEFYK